MQLEKFTVWYISYIPSSPYHMTIFKLAEFKSHINLSTVDLGIIYLTENTVWTHWNVYTRLWNLDNEEETKLGVFEMWCYRKTLCRRERPKTEYMEQQIMEDTKDTRS